MTEAEAGAAQLQGKDHQGAPATPRAGRGRGGPCTDTRATKDSLQTAEQAQPSRPRDRRLARAAMTVCTSAV